MNDHRGKNQFVERQGDWACMKCKNLNFSFRIICNRCKLSKQDVNNFNDSFINSMKNSQNTNHYQQHAVLSEKNEESKLKSFVFKSK